MKHFGDIAKLSGHMVPLVDVVTGGSPCQDLSVAGKREGLAGERSGLFMEQIRLIKEMRDESYKKLQERGADFTVRDIRPRFMVWENVPGAFSSNKGEDFRTVLEETAKVAERNASIPRFERGKWAHAGAIMGNGWSIAWRVHDAQFWGVPQRRKRISLVADFGGESAPEILFERESVSWDTEESGEQGQGIATDVRSGIEKTSRAVSFQERAGKPGGGKGILIQNERTGALSTLNNQSVCYGISAYESNAMKSGNPNSGIYEAETARTLDLNGGSPACNQGGMAVVQCFDAYNQSVCHTFRKQGHPQNAEQGQGWEETNINDTLNIFDNSEGRTPTLVLENHPADSRVKISEDGVVQTLSSRMGTGGGNVPMVMESEPMIASKASFFMRASQTGTADTLVATDYKDPQLVAYGLDRASFNQGKNAKYDFQINEEKIGCQVAKGPGAVFNQSVVRRLTPLECERLQGYPDGWTDIGDWIDSKGKKHKGDSDSPRYKALGNSIALPFWQWMAARMTKVLKDSGQDKPTMASLFDGIGGFPLVFSRCGCKPLWASEIEEFPIAVTKIRFPEEQ